MRIYVVACRVLSRELNALAAQHTNIIDLLYLPQGLHDVPSILQSRLQQSIDQLYIDLEDGLVKNKPDAIAFGYGLCSNGVVGLTARDIPLVVPRTDDCIGLFLGSQQRYLSLFETMNGTYWLNSGWLESCGTVLRKKEAHQRWQMYAEKYGEDNADFLMEQEDLWLKRYNTCAFIHSNTFHRDIYEQTAIKFAQKNQWRYQYIEGDNSMLKMMLDGNWPAKHFLVCPPGCRIEADYTGLKVKAVKI